ncbi:MAG: BrnA antitoxin family protein [Pyrinomonadaceae bacterium]
MKDEEIDFSDIPPITPEMFKTPVIRRGLKLRGKTSEESLIIDRDIIEFFKSQGKNYQAKINQLLRDYIEAHQTK